MMKSHAHDLTLEDVTSLLANSSAGRVADVELHRAVEGFLFDEADLLDGLRYGEWLELIGDPGCYWVPLDPAAESPWPVLNLIFDDRKQLEDRLYRYSIGSVWSQDPASATARVLGNVRVFNLDIDGYLLATSRYSLTESRNGEVRSYGGTYRHVIEVDHDRFRIVGKRATLVNSLSYLPSITFLL
jgi:3-phenylpropionate/cinnamic acid dioxygenase small subunit